MSFWVSNTVDWLRVTKVTFFITDIKTQQVESCDLAADWLHENAGKQCLEFGTTREYVKPKTARYQNWLVFRNLEGSDQFFDLFPQFG